MAAHTPPIYLDHAASSPMEPAAINAMVRWCGARGNPSAEHASAKEARAMFAAFKKEIAAACGLPLEGPGAWTVLFTSGGSEANTHIVTACARSFMARTGRTPHLVISATEHKSLAEACRLLVRDRLATLTVLPVGHAGPGLGQVTPAALTAALRPDTCLVSIIAANNETGVLADLAPLAAAAHAARVPVFVDAVQLFGKLPFRPAASGVDAFSCSFHKLGGPPGVGLLAVRNALVAGYKLCGLVCGSQNGGLRGGTENVCGIGASFVAFRLALADGPAKSAQTRRLRESLKAALATRLPSFALDDYPPDPLPSRDGGITPARPPPGAGSADARRAIAAAEAAGPPVLVWLAPREPERVLPGMLLIAVRRPGICGRAIRGALEARGVVVSVGAACDAAAAAHGASATVAAMRVPAALTGGVIRVSMGPHTTAQELGAFARHFLAVVATSEGLSTPARQALERAGRPLTAPLLPRPALALELRPARAGGPAARARAPAKKAPAKKRAAKRAH